MHFVLIHGYSGHPEDLAPLARGLEAVYGPGAARQVALHPQGQGGQAPAFDLEAFLAILRAAFREAPPGPLAVVGHSTGGSLALLALEELRPDLLVLAGTPPQVDGSHLARLEAATRPGHAPPDFLDTAHLVRTIQAAGKKGLPQGIPTLLLHGQADDLVPLEDLRHWGEVPGVRTVVLPGAGHDLFSGPAGSQALAIILEACLPTPPLSEADLARLRHLEPTVVAYAEGKPDGLQALARSPSAQRALHPGRALPTGLGLVAPAPLLANVEATTRCLHACPACARTQHPPHRGDLSSATFTDILAQLPHASRITLVGLGEPTLNPQLCEFVHEGAAQGRAVSLVTSGAALTPSLAQSLVTAGLSAVTFSLDAADPDLAARLRPGVDFDHTRQALTQAAQVFGPALPMAVFTAVCQDNARHLDAVADLVLQLGARAWMLSDLNFAENQPRALATTSDPGNREAIRASIERALEAGLPVLGVRALEELGKPFRLREYLLRPADRLWERPTTHTACLSPWQTAAIGADGTLTVCDCQPEVIVGNLRHTPFLELWNGPVLRQLREELLTGHLRPACRTCPRL